MKKRGLDRIATRAPLDFIMKYIKPTPELCGATFDGIIHLPYKVLKHELPDLFREGRYEEGLALFLRHSRKNRTFKRLRRRPIEEKLAFIKWLKEQYKKLEAMEREYLHRPPRSKLSRAGITDLDVLGDRNLIDSLAGGDVTKWAQVEQLPYEVLFDKQLRNAIMGDIEDRLERIRKEEAQAAKTRRR